MALDRSPELKTACGSDGVMACEMSIKGGHFVLVPMAKLISKKYVKHQQGKNTM